MAYTYVLCEEKKGETLSPAFLVAVAREAFPQELSVEERLVAVHAFAQGIHPTRSFYPNNLWTDRKVAELFPGLPIEYINSPEEWEGFHERLPAEGWKWETNGSTDFEKCIAPQLAPSEPEAYSGRYDEIEVYYDDGEEYRPGEDFKLTVSFMVSAILTILASEVRAAFYEAHEKIKKKIQGIAKYFKAEINIE